MILIFSFMLNNGVIDSLKTSKHLAEKISAIRSSTYVLINYGSFEETLLFYTGKRLYLAGYMGELEMGAQHPDARPYFLSEDSFRKLFSSGKPALVVIKSKRLHQFKSNNSAFQLLTCEDELCLIGNEAFLQQYKGNAARLF